MLHMKFLYIWIIGSREEEVYMYFPNCISLCKMKRPQVGPFLGGFFFMRKLYRPCPEDVVCHISEYLDCQFVRRTPSKIHQILPLFAPYWVPICVNPLIFSNLNPHSLKMLPNEFG